MTETDELQSKANFVASQPEEVAINGDYLRLAPADAPPERHAPLTSDNGGSTRWRFCYRRSRWFWVNVIVLCVLLSVIGVVVVKHYGPRIMNEEVIPIINCLTKTLSPPVLAAIVFGALALFPTLVLPTTPFKWVAGMTFGYGIGFLLISAGYAIGVTLPYLIGCQLFLQKIKIWLDKHPQHAAVVRLAGDGNWFHQFRATVLIRLAPVPFGIFNFTAAATGVKYGPYLVGSLLGLAPDIIVAIYSGILIRKVAEAMEEHAPVSKFQIILDCIGFCLTVVATIIIGFYAKRKLEQLQLQEQEEPQPVV